jgi:RNA polymerase sigma-70 factor, ECF subfamily
MQAERPEGTPPAAGAGSRHDVLVDEHGDAIGRACMAWLGEGAAAQAAVEEIFVEAVSGMATRGGEGTVRGWLFGLAQRVCARRLEALVTTTKPLGDDFADTQRAPSTQVERTRRALLELVPTERDAVVLRFVAGLTLPDVAQAARVDEKTARERVNRGLSKLRALLAEGS